MLQYTVSPLGLGVRGVINLYYSILNTLPASVLRTGVNGGKYIESNADNNGTTYVDRLTFVNNNA